MNVQLLRQEREPTPAEVRRQLDSFLSEFELWYRDKAEREHLSITDRRFAFRVNRIRD